MLRRSCRPTWRRLAFLACAVMTICLASCRGSRITSDSKNSTLSTRKSEVLELLNESERRVVVTSYEAKNAKTAVSLGTKSVNVRANISFDYGKDTKLAARLIFPPISVGQVTVSPGMAKISSKYLDKNKSIALPPYANDILQYTILGSLPPAYKYFGEKDFSNFEIHLNSKDEYEIERSDRSAQIFLSISGEDKTLTSAKVLFAEYYTEIHVDQYKRFDGILLPSKVNVSVRPSDSKTSTKLEIEISDVTLHYEL